MTHLRSVMAVVLLAVGEASPTHAGNIVVNGGFETGFFSGWEVSDSSFGTFVARAHLPGMFLIAVTISPLWGRAANSGGSREA